MFRFFKLFILLMSLSHLSIAQKKIRLNGIPDTTVDEIIKGNPEKSEAIYGFEEVYIASDQQKALSLREIPVSDITKDIYYESTDERVFDGSSLSLGKNPKDILIKPKKTGTSYLLLYDQVPGQAVRGSTLYKMFRVTATTQGLLDLMQGLKVKIGDVEGLKIRIIGQEVVLDGKIIAPKELRRALSVYNTYVARGQPVEWLAEMSPVGMDLLAKKIEDEIAGGPNKPRTVRVKVLNGTFILEGQVDTRVERELAQQTCRAMMQDVFTLDPPNLQKRAFQNIGDCMVRIRFRQPPPSPPGKLLNITADFVVMNKNYLKSFDFRWAPGVSGQGEAQFSSDIGRLLAGFTGTVRNLFPRLRTLKNNNQLRILKSLTLLTRDYPPGTNPPIKPKITDSLQIPFTFTDSEGRTQSNVREVLTSMSVFAQSVPNSDKINLGITLNQSELQAEGGDSGNAPVQNNELVTEVIIGDNESVALGGLITERERIGQSKPNNNNDFSLFKLSREQNFSKDKNQIIIFVTPRRVRSTLEETQKLKRKFRLK